MANPSIEELQKSDEYELIAELNHKQIKAFVIEQLSAGGWLVKSYMIYQVLMITLGAFIITWSVILAFQHQYLPLYWVIAALVFCFSLLIIIHELLHGIAIKASGAKKVNYGAYFRKFIFYAEADQHVLNKPQFTFIALAPFVTIKVLTILGCLLTFHHPLAFFISLVMCAHSLFCAGDIGLLSLFYRNKDVDIYTYDMRAEKKSYYFKKV